MPLANHRGGFPALRSHDYGLVAYQRTKAKDALHQVRLKGNGSYAFYVRWENSARTRLIVSHPIASRSKRADAGHLAVKSVNRTVGENPSGMLD
jgi:hypothetical protein